MLAHYDHSCYGYGCCATSSELACLQIARTGDIVALGGLKDVITGETLCDEKAPIMLERMEFPDPVIKVIGLHVACSSLSVNGKNMVHCTTHISASGGLLTHHLPILTDRTDAVQTHSDVVTGAFEPRKCPRYCLKSKFDVVYFCILN